VNRLSRATMNQGNNFGLVAIDGPGRSAHQPANPHESGDIIISSTGTQLYSARFMR